VENKQTLYENTAATPSPAATPQNQTQLQYTLYPDAGEFDGTASVSIPEIPVPISASPAVSSPTPPVLTQKIDAIPSVSYTTTANLPTSSAPDKTGSFSRILLRCFFGAMVLFALLVYGDLLLSRVGTISEETLIKTMVGAVFGGADRVAIVPTSLPSQPSIPQDSENPNTDTLSPPANEEENSQGTLPTDATAIRDLSSPSPDGLGIINETPYTPDLAALSQTAPVIPPLSTLSAIYGEQAPVVLILHTHGTEGFADSSAEGYHTSDRTRNICAVGDALYTVLTNAGIPTIHCTEMFDEEAFDMAYYNASRYIRETLAAYPSIRYILDIHRDAIVTSDAIGIRPYTEQNGTGYAQLMFVVGTDHGGSGHTTWQDNLALAARLQSSIHTQFPTLMRDINLRSASFNAQYAPGALLIEAGAAASTLEEAIRSVKVLGDALVQEILGTSR